MKKLLLLVSVLALIPLSTLATDLNDALESVQLSNGVEGDYQVDSNQANFVISTAHSQGNKVYATGNFSTELWYKEGYGTNGFDSGDYVVGTTLSFDSSDFTTDYAVIGE